MRRTILTILAVALACLVVTAILITVLLDKEKILEIATNTLQEQTGATLSVGGDTNLSLFPTLGLSVADAAITLPEKSQPDLKMRALNIGIQFMPLLSGSVQIDTFTLDGLEARIELAEEENPIDTSKMSDSELDNYYAKRRQEKKAAGDAAGAEAALAVPLALNVKKLAITDAQIELVDPKGAPSTKIHLVSLTASNLNLEGRAIPLDITVRIPGEDVIEAEIETRFSINQDTQKATVETLKVVVTGATPKPLTLTGNGIVDLQRMIADLKIKIEVDEISGKGVLRYASFESPQIDSKLHFNLFDPAILIVASPDAAVAAPKGDSATGDEPLPLEALRNLDTRAALTIDQARFDAHTINNLQAKLRAVDGVINLNNITGELHGGQIKARAVFNAKHNLATLDTTGSLEALDIAKAVAATGSTAKLSGSAKLGWQLKSKGRTANELTGALNGPIELDTQEVVLEGTNVEALLCQAVALTNQKKITNTLPPRTNVESLGAKIQLADGIATLQPLNAKLANVGLSGDGEFDLLSKDFAMTLNASLSKSLEELDAACSVSNRITSIDWPIDCSGNLSGEPGKWCGVDADEIVKDLATVEAKKKVKKKANKYLQKLLEKNKSKEKAKAAE